MRYGYLLTISLVVFGLACDGGREDPSTEAPASSSDADPANPRNDDPGEVSGPVDEALADQGATLFQTKGCLGCHTIGGGRLTGPDLAGVTDRRTRTWMLAMIVNPDSMLKNDDTARQLFAEYMTPMLNMNVTREEAQAIYEYLKREGN